MWFSKTLPVSDINRAASTGAQSAPSKSAPLSVVASNGGVAMPDTMSEMKDIPKGRMVNDAVGMAGEWESDFAIIEELPSVAIILCTEKVYGKPTMYDVARRLEQKGYRNKKIIRVTGEIIKSLHERKNTEQQKSNDSLVSANATNVEKIARDLIDDAIDMRASDIHIETRGGHADVFFRVNGKRIFHANIAAATAKSIGVVLYSVHADASSKDVTWDSQQVMDGVIDHSSRDGKDVQLRFSSSPIHPSGNFHIVMRVLMMDGTGEDLEMLGYEPEMLAMINSLLTGSTGMVIICGPTNSGKSTSMQAMMRSIHRRRGDTIKLITVEDPVEYVVPGACQIGVARKKKSVQDAVTGSAFTTFLRGTLRQDPDVVVVGEIRDFDSAAVVKDLVLAGRKLLTTLHAYSAMWSFVRLREIGVPMSLLTMPGFISGVVYQRLVPTLCTCAIPLTDPEAQQRLPADVLYRVQQVVDLARDPVRVRGDGCPKCRYTGIAGRTICAELVVPDHKLLALLAEEHFIKAQEYWMNAGLMSVDGLGVTALAHAISKIKKGIIDPMDAEEQIGLLTSDVVVTETVPETHEIPALSGAQPNAFAIRG